MTNLPQPITNQSIKRWAENVIAELKARTPKSSSSILIKRTEGGTTFELARAFDSYLSFDVIRHTDTGVGVRCGRWTRTVGLDSWEIDCDKDGGGTSDDPADTFSISGIGANGWIYIELDDGIAPTQLTPAFTTSDPTAYIDAENKRRYIARIAWDGTRISQIRQWGPRGHIEDYMMRPDSDSLNYIGADLGGGLFEYELQQFGWSGAASEAIDDFDLISYKDDDNGGGAGTGTDKQKYIGYGALMDQLLVDLPTRDGFDAFAVLVVAAGGGSGVHTDLDFTGSTAGDGGQNSDHDQRYTVIGADYTDNGGGVGGVWFQSIGRGSSDGSSSADGQAIDLTNGELKLTAGDTVLDWDAQTASDSGGDTAIQWGARRLDDATSLISVDWENKYLYRQDADGIAVNWDAGYCYDGNDILSIEWLDRHLKNSANVVVLDWEDFQLNSDWTCTGDFEVSNTANKFVHDGNDGVTLTDWTSGGIVSGANVEELTIRVQLAAGGPPQNIKVLAIT